MPTVSLPYVKVVPFYAYLIRINNNTIGSIQRITVNSDRQEVQRIREIGNSRGAEVKEFVWGGVNTTIDIERLEIYSASLMQTIGYASFYSLEDFNFTFDIQEIMYKADEDSNPLRFGQLPLAPTFEESQSSHTLWRCITYKDCLPVKWSKTIDKNTIQVVENMQVFCRTIKVSSYSGIFNPEG